MAYNRSILLPPYLNTSTWVELTAALDKLFLDTSTATTQLQGVRNPYVVGPQIQDAITSGSMFDTGNAQYQQDLQTLLKQLTFNGLPLNNPTYLNSTQALMLFRNLGAYWYSKGTGKIIDFVNFTMGASLTMINLWTHDYQHFIPELVLDSTSGLMLENPLLLNNKITDPNPDPLNTYYPTTHVSMALGGSPAFKNATADEFLQFFNDVFNYNLVLYEITDENTLKIGQPDQQNLISMGLFYENVVYPTLVQY